MIRNLNRLILLVSIVGAPLAVVGLAALLFASSVSKAAEPSNDPIPQSEVDRYGAHCRAGRAYEDYVLRHWFDLYCACIGRTAPHLFTATQFRGLTRGPITDRILEQLGIARSKLKQMIARCQREAEPARRSLTSSSRQIGTDAPQFTSDERGRTLRAKLDEVYNSNSGARRNRFDVTDVIVPYIPVGTPFQDAEAILRAAGFTVRAHPDLSTSLDINRPIDWYAVMAEISPFNSWVFFRTDLYVMLVPDVPGHYTTVSRLKGTFFSEGP